MPYKDPHCQAAVECRKRAQKKYREKHKEQRRKYQREAYQKNPQKFLARNKLWRLNNSEKIKKMAEKWRLNNIEKVRNYSRKAVKKYRLKHREEIQLKRKKERLQCLIHYGGNPPKCQCCGESHIEFLTIDHIKGGGNQHRKQIKRRIFDWLIKNNFPEGYQILCWNCNFSKAHSTKNKYYQKVRLEILNHYSHNHPKCECCNKENIVYLAVDHIDGSAYRQQKIIGSGFNFYLWLRRNGYPSGYRILCHNCNSSLGLYGYCPHKNFV